jgi:uncharacterized protein (DUF1778 family)
VPHQYLEQLVLLVEAAVAHEATQFSITQVVLEALAVVEAQQRVMVRSVKVVPVLPEPSRAVLDL